MGGYGRRLFWFWRRRRSPWRDALTQTVARRKSQSSMVSTTNNDSKFHIFIFVVSF